jgi:hypothetical protein
MTEDKVIELLNAANYNFEKMDDKFSRYDAFDPKLGIMLEIKCRKKHYPDTMLEKMKYDWNKEFAEENGFDFFYAVSMPHEDGHRLYVFNPSAMEEEDEYDFKWHTKKLPANTAFNGSRWIDKEVGYLHIDDAFVAIEERTKH